MVAFSTKYMLRSILAAFKRRRKKSLARETKTFWRKKGFLGRKTPFAKPFSAFQKLRAAPEIATIYLEQVIKQNDWTLLPIGRHFCLWFYGRARAKEIWALDNRLTNQTKVPFVQRSVDFRRPVSGPNSCRKAFGTRRNICVVDLWRQRVVSISSWLFQCSGLSSSSAQMQMDCQETEPCCDSLLPQ